MYMWSLVYSHIYAYPMPFSLNYWYAFGSLCGLSLVGMIVTGVLLSMHYIPSVVMAFASVEHIMRDVVNGYLLRYTHANLASLFFSVVYLHMLKGTYYKSYRLPRGSLWVSGTIILVVTIVTAFVGYVLPYGSMSLAGSTVITNLVTTVPLLGYDILVFILGGHSVGQPTLNRFLSFHFLLPFVLVGISLLHIVLLHIVGSTSPTRLNSLNSSSSFYPYAILKDAVCLVSVLLVLLVLVALDPNLLGHSDNYVEANPLVTPAHVVPEWYLLAFYCMLRVIPSKLGGLLVMLGSLVVISFAPYLSSYSALSPSFSSKLRSYWFYLFVSLVMCLGRLGSLDVAYPYSEVGFVATLLFFVNWLFLA